MSSRDTLSRKTGHRTATALALTGALLLAGAATSCGSGSSGGGVSGSAYSLSSMSGTVRDGAAGLQGVTVSIGTNMAMTDVNGNFIIPSVGLVPSGQVTVEIDGSTAGAPGQFPVLDVVVSLLPGQTDATLPQIIVLPDLFNANSANQTVATDVTGAVTAPINVTGAQSDISVAAPTGTIITIAGVVSAGNVDLNVTPVPPAEVPMALPDGLVGGSFVTIQPGNSAFDPPGAPMGLDVVLPNDLDFPVGTVVDIWSFDHDAGAWVNRSAETGETGIVVDVGGGQTEIQASGVIVEGGWHSPAITVDPDCATAFHGTVVDLGTGDGIPGATVALSTGQFASTDANGDFSFDSVPAYDVAALAADPQNCTAQAFDWEIVLPPSFGSLSTTGTVNAIDVTTGGMTTLADVSFTIGTLGSLTGIVNGDGATPNEQLFLTPPTGPDIAIDLNPDGSFFVLGLDAGNYMASFMFDGQTVPYMTQFSIEANEITTLNMQFVPGTGAEDITVLVLEDDDIESTPMIPAASAQVLLRGTDVGSASGIVLTTDVNGMATFTNVTGPYTVTASKDLLMGVDTLRFASSLVDYDPTGTTIGMIIWAEADPAPAVLNATLSGTVSNMPTLAGTETMEVQAEATNFMGDLIFFGSTVVNPGDGTYSMSIPSSTDLDITLAHMDRQATSQIIATMGSPAVSGVAGGQILTHDFDFGSSGVIAWDQPVNVTFSNVMPGLPNTFLCADVFDLTNGILFAYDIYSGPAQNVTLNIPDLNDANLSGYTFDVFAENEDGGGDFQECDLFPIAGVTGMNFDFIPVPSIAVPSDGGSYSVAQFADLTLTFTESPSAFGVSGFNYFEFESDGGGTPPQGIDGACWVIIFPVGVESFTMPPSPNPMFGAGESILGDVVQQRATPQPTIYNTFFNANVEQNMTDLITGMTAECSSETTVSFTLTP